MRKWFGNRKELAAIRTVCSHVQNMVTGVIRGYRYKMRSVYAHFPINMQIEESGGVVAVRLPELDLSVQKYGQSKLL